MYRDISYRYIDTQKDQSMTALELTHSTLGTTNINLNTGFFLQDLSNTLFNTMDSSTI